jgi:uncharacterized protein YndB with AHSA1/START domain
MTAVTDAALGVVRAVVEVAAPPEKVWRALTDPKELEVWWGSGDAYQTFDWKSDLRPGGGRSCRARAPGREELSTVEGEYVTVEPPRLLEFTWRASWDPHGETRVRMELDPVPAGTRVTVIHSGFGEDAKRTGGYADGWTRVLGWLSARMASGR